MKKLINFFRGSARLTVTGGFPERFLNLCAQAGVRFWDVEWLEDGGVALAAARRDLERCAALAERAGCTLETGPGRGAPAALDRLRRRYALLAGMAASLAAVCVLSQFILWVEVSGNETVPTAAIVTELRRLGLGPGTYGPGVDERAVSQGLLLRLEGLAWCAVNLHGTRAEVIVREVVVPPEVADERVTGSIVARTAGMVERLEVRQGEAAVAQGATVLEGEVLITGELVEPLPEYSTATPEHRQVRADGAVYARTWRTLSAQIPLTAAVKTSAGEGQSRWSLCFLGRRVNFYGNSGISYPQYDKISQVWTARLPGGQELPLSLRRETARPYETTETALDAGAAQTMLEERLRSALAERVGTGEVLSTQVSARIADGTLTVTLTAECREEIGRFSPFQAPEDGD